MTQIIYNAQTGEKTMTKLPDEPIIEEQTEPTIGERTKALEKTMLFIIMGGGM